MSICPVFDWGLFSGEPAPTYVYRNTFEMTFDATTITFPAPQFGNKFETSPREIKREDIRKQWISYRDASWVGINTLRYQFDNIDKTVVDNYLTFLTDSLGRPISVTDHYTITFNAIIVEPEASVGYFGTGTECKNTAEVILRWLP